MNPSTSPMALFGQHARGIESRSVRGFDPGVVSPGFGLRGPCVGCAQPPRMRAVGALSGLGDWFTDGLNAVTGSVTSVLGAVTGSTAAAEAQRNAVAIAQAQAAADMESSRAFSSAIPWVAGAIAVVGIAVVVLRK